MQFGDLVKLAEMMGYAKKNSRLELEDKPAAKKRRRVIELDDDEDDEPKKKSKKSKASSGDAKDTRKEVRLGYSPKFGRGAVAHLNKQSNFIKVTSDAIVLIKTKDHGKIRHDLLSFAQHACCEADEVGKTFRFAKGHVTLWGKKINLSALVKKAKDSLELSEGSSESSCSSSEDSCSDSE